MEYYKCLADVVQLEKCLYLKTFFRVTNVIFFQNNNMKLRLFANIVLKSLAASAYHLK